MYAVQFRSLYASAEVFAEWKQSLTSLCVNSIWNFRSARNSWTSRRRPTDTPCSKLDPSSQSASVPNWIVTLTTRHFCLVYDIKAQGGGATAINIAYDTSLKVFKSSIAHPLEMPSDLTGSRKKDGDCNLPLSSSMAKIKGWAIPLASTSIIL